MKTKAISILFAISIIFQTAQAHAVATALLFNGTGSSPGDVAALAKILTSMGISYETASSAKINSMSRTTLAKYKMIVWPGGNSIDMGNSLTYTATANIKSAVSRYGVSYIGFCAGAFMAESSNLYNVFNLAPTWFDFYQPNLIDMVVTHFPDGSQRHLVYWQGPHVQGFGSVIAKYPNGQAAIAEGKVGNGFVILSGVHPEAPADWRTGFATQDFDGVTADINFTKTLMNAALYRMPLPSY